MAELTGAGKVALVTGASSGIGRAVAERLAAAGYRVFGTSRKAAGGPAGGIEMLQLDLNGEESIAAGAAQVLRDGGRIDVLINNAGYLLEGAVEEVTLDEARGQFETNFFGPARLTRALLPAMRAQESGHIINITSLAGVVPLPFWGYYNASKFALEGLTETLRFELKPFGIHVSAIEAGLIKTRFYTDDQTASPIADYAAAHGRFRKKMAEFEAKAPGPDVVADAVMRAVRARKPALRYRVTREATIFTQLRRWFPEGLYEIGLRSSFRLDDAAY
jgi:NAD(P)-dependent dehydrogenase (short-subunit alcohol dehydrogenase family)